MMTTKDRERNALEQIRGIVAELGVGSYIAAAFEGAFEIAEENIENDFACSLRDRWEGRCKTAEDKVESLKRELAQSKKDYAEARDDAFAESEAKNRQIEQLSARRDELLSQLEQGAKLCAENFAKFREQEARAEAAEAQIIRLKAKLYDLLIKD